MAAAVEDRRYPHVERAHWKTDVLAIVVYVTVVLGGIVAMVETFGWDWAPVLLLLGWAWALCQVANWAQAWVWRRGRQ